MDPKLRLDQETQELVENIDPEISQRYPGLFDETGEYAKFMIKDTDGGLTPRYGDLEELSRDIHPNKVHRVVKEEGIEDALEQYEQIIQDIQSRVVDLILGAGVKELLENDGLRF